MDDLLRLVGVLDGLLWRPVRLCRQLAGVPRAPMVVLDSHVAGRYGAKHAWAHGVPAPSSGVDYVLEMPPYPWVRAPLGPLRRSKAKARL